MVIPKSNQELSLIHISVVKPGRMMFEIAGVPEEVAREAFRLASHKLPVKTKFVRKGEEK